MSSVADCSASLVLVFPPPVHPTGPPLGVASLAAWMRRRFGQGSVRALDLNLAHYLQARRWMEDGRLKLKLKGRDRDETVRETGEAFDVFTGLRGMGPFMDSEAYEGFASTYRSFESVWNGLLDHCARKALAGLPVPPLIEAYWDELAAPLMRWKPRLAGFSVLFSRQLVFALALARRVKAYGGRVVLGGAALSTMPDPQGLLAEETIFEVAGKPRSVNVRRLVDFIVVGEGEEGLAELADRLDGDRSRVPGLAYRENGRVLTNAPRMVEDLTKLPPPDFADFPLRRYHSPQTVLPYGASRGCFWQRCAFCTHSRSYLAYREEPVAQTVFRLEELAEKLGACHFALVDEMIHPRRFAALSRRLEDRASGIFYSAYAKPTRGFGRSLLERAYRSGSRVMLWGVESGSPRVVALMRKGQRLEDVERILGESHEAGIWNLVFLLFGFPTETAEEWDATLDLLRRHGGHIDALSASRFVLTPGSRIHEEPEAFHVRLLPERSYRDPVSTGCAYEATRGLTPEEILARFQGQRGFLETFGRSGHLGVFRDHLLVKAAAASRPSSGAARA